MGNWQETANIEDVVDRCHEDDHWADYSTPYGVPNGQRCSGCDNLGTHAEPDFWCAVLVREPGAGDSYAETCPDWTPRDTKGGSNA